jgi:hypothetical protein
MKAKKRIPKGGKSRSLRRRAARAEPTGCQYVAVCTPYAAE